MLKLNLNEESRTVNDVRLPPKEFQALSLLLKAHTSFSRCVPSKEVSRHLWVDQKFNSLKVRRLMYTLRNILNNNGIDIEIKAKVGNGYYLSSETFDVQEFKLNNVSVAVEVPPIVIVVDEDPRLEVKDENEIPTLIRGNIT